MKTWHTKDKATWGEGPWLTEPDKAHWIHNGLDCLIFRNNLGALCGYVGIPESHPYFEKHYSNEPIWELECHGGLTFSDHCHETDDPSQGICHEEECAANKKVWWLGFDCAHACDLIPRMGNDSYPFYDATYKDFTYVKQEVENLADQLKAIP